ncbi:AAA family ATPase [Desulfonatronovibrio magnus]|uniref:AAA family ATPase n=1 Tax=Desulfonatronovibrio magnus TaxID=698827 RepID=UPI0005EBEBD3|nr:AAA family ATPase [Desulfonatronovibrio magnus]
MQDIKRIPYGKGDFEAVNAQNDYYVDKTVFIPIVEKSPHIFLIRPRRFGKTLFLSMLHSYYDIAKDDRFEEFFRDTWILNNPTPERGKYMVLDFNFSAVIKDKDKVQEDFNNYCTIKLNTFVSKYAKYLPDTLIKKMDIERTAHEKLHVLMSELAESDLKIYLLIDEYDNFTNTLLAEYGPLEYRKIVREAGYFKQFFTNLKAMASGSGAGLARMFITGVSPVTMDDVTSGFNVGNNVSMDEEFHEALGFTDKDVREIMEYYSSRGLFHLDEQEALQVMQKWYGGYRFSKRASNKVFNTDAILYFMGKSMNKNHVPDYLIDDNLRMDYGKLRHLIVLDQDLNGNFSRLKEIIENGSIVSDITKSFPYEKLADSSNFISLLYFFGLLTFKGEYQEGDPVLTIPNEAIRTMMYEYIRESYEDVDVFAVDMYHLRDKFRKLAYRGEFKPVFEFLASEINRQTRVRDYIQGEKVIQAFFLAYLGICDFYISLSEEELNKGYADIVLKPFCIKYRDIGYAYLLEFKYIPRTDDKRKLEKRLQEKISMSRKQLARYADNEHLHKMLSLAPYGQVRLKKAIIVFHGWELVYMEEVMGDGERGLKCAAG